MKNKTKSKKTRIIIKMIRGFLIIVGAFITAYGLEAVLIPNSVSDGGGNGPQYCWITVNWLTPLVY